MNPQPVKRIFAGTDAYMAEQARIAHGLVTADLTRFTQFDSTITTPYLTQFMTSITAADTVVADTAVIDQQGQATELLDAAMEAARTKYREIKHFAEKAFPNSPATLGEFGTNDYDKARQSPTKMVQFLDELSKAAVKYQTQLVAAGMTAASVAAIQTLRADLLTKNTGQKTFKKQRPKLTEDRITVLNTCYQKLALLNSTGQLVYGNDYAKQQQFVYNPYGETETLDFEGTLAAAHTAAIAEIPFNEDNFFTFRNTGLVPLVFCLSTSPDTVEGITVFIGGGAVISKPAAELNANATHLVVQNTDTLNAGNYEVRVEE